MREGTELKKEDLTQAPTFSRIPVRISGMARSVKSTCRHAHASATPNVHFYRLTAQAEEIRGQSYLVSISK